MLEKSDDKFETFLFVVVADEEEEEAAACRCCRLDMLPSERRWFRCALLLLLLVPVAVGP